jgi:SAM-dependent methyltransferase
LTTSDFPSFVDPYSAIPDLYDLEHDAFEDDLPMTLHFASATDLPVLELGCGTGRLLQALADHEIAVTGLDQSRSMLDSALRRVSTSQSGSRVTLIEGDMRDAGRSVVGPFGLAVYSLNALMHLPAIEDQMASLASVYSVLGPDGSVLIDLMNPHPEQLVHLGSGVLLEGSWSLPNGDSVDKWSHRSIHPAAQLIETTIWYDIIAPAGDLRRVRTQFDHRYVHAAELQLMLQASGFAEINFFGGYELEPYDDDSDRLIAHAYRST